jgi:hypothetical protein
VVHGGIVLPYQGEPERIAADCVRHVRRRGPAPPTAFAVSCAAVTVWALLALKGVAFFVFACCALILGVALPVTLVVLWGKWQDSYTQPLASVFLAAVLLGTITWRFVSRRDPDYKGEVLGAREAAAIRDRVQAAARSRPR